VRGVRIDPARSPCLVRIDWIALTCFVRGETEPRRLLFDSADALTRFAMRGMRPLLGALYAVDSNDPQLELDLRRELGGATAYEVLIEIAYAVLLADQRQPASLERRLKEPSKAAKRFVRQLENRTGVPLGRPLRRAWRRMRRLRR
jgi:hypothetical protein